MRVHSFRAVVAMALHEMILCVAAARDLCGDGIACAAMHGGAQQIVCGVCLWQSFEDSSNISISYNLLYFTWWRGIT
jgi:hypothetical protein